jgi:putative transposase
MYEYRKLSRQQQAEVVAERRRRQHPWHGPPHFEAPGEYRIITATCYNHQKILSTEERLEWFANELLRELRGLRIDCAAWCVLPNHYHLLVQIHNMRHFAKAIGQLHGRTSLQINLKDGQVGRQVWCRCQDRIMRSERHFFTSINYIHNNPVKHGYVAKWQAWPFSSVHWYLREKGRDWLLELWHEYPVLNYGAGWDD